MLFCIREHQLFIAMKKYIFVTIFAVLTLLTVFILKHQWINKELLTSNDTSKKEVIASSNNYDEITKIIDKNGVKSSHSEKSITELIEDKSISLDKKVKVLWSMIEKYGLNSETGSILMEYMANIGPLTLTDELINVFDNASSHNKNLILLALKNSFFNVENDEFGIDREEAYDFMEKIQQFSLSRIQLISDGDSESNSHIIDLMVTTCPTDTVINQINDLQTKYGNNFFSSEDYAKIQSSIAASDVGLQADRFVSLFNEAEIEKDLQRKQLINTEIQFSIARLLLSNDINPYDSTTPESRYNIHDYLIKNKPSINDLGNTGLTYTEWAKAMILVSSNNQEDEINTQYNMIMETQDTREIAAIISINTEKISDELKKQGSINQILDTIYK